MHDTADARLASGDNEPSKLPNAATRETRPTPAGSNTEANFQGHDGERERKQRAAVVPACGEPVPAIEPKPSGRGGLRNPPSGSVSMGAETIPGATNKRFGEAPSVGRASIAAVGPDPRRGGSPYWIAHSVPTPCRRPRSRIGTTTEWLCGGGHFRRRGTALRSHRWHRSSRRRHGPGQGRGGRRSHPQMAVRKAVPWPLAREEGPLGRGRELPLAGWNHPIRDRTGLLCESAARHRRSNPRMEFQNGPHVRGTDNRVVVRPVPTQIVCPGASGLQRSCGLPGQRSTRSLASRPPRLWGTGYRPRNRARDRSAP